LGLDRPDQGRPALSENYNLDALIQQALAGRVDSLYASVAVINHQLDQVLKRPGALVFDPGLPYSRDDYHLSSMKYPDQVRDFSDWMSNHRAWINTLKKKYGVEKGVPAK
jgi:hypothetical protein